MNPASHADRAAQVLRSLSKLDADDYEMRIEAAMLAGTQLLNVCLHRMGITSDVEDVMHAEYLGGPVRIKADLLAPGLVDLLLRIDPDSHEDLRDRGLLYAALDCYGLAVDDLEAYLARGAPTREARELREKIDDLRRRSTRLH